ncbi:MAG: TonB-dependent receptor [Treponema sp.]|nr:TonB-dependent receptor [Treponema sp.]
MKKTGLFILTFFLTSFAFSADLRVFVVDKDLDYPLEGARIVLEKNTETQAFADEDGNAVLTLPDSVVSGKVKVSFPGYKDVSVEFNGTDETVTVAMSISGVIEGKGIVVNRASPDSTEEKTGVSTVMTKKQMASTANVGLVEDCMASVRTLPGVSYSGAWGTEPSVRGGEPRELACLLDGMYMMFPYHWGGGASVFNPSMIESIKLSNGVFPSKYGRASSGLLEANTLKPDYENLHVNASLSTTCADAFVQVPFGKNVGGLLFGSHLTYLDPLVWAAQKAGVEDLDMIKRAPYIRDLFLKTNFTPTPELDISVIGFFGSDGLEIDQTSEDEKSGVKTHAIMNYDIYQALGGVNIKYLASDSLLFRGVFSYNGMFEDMNLNAVESGTVKYNKDFVDKFHDSYPDKVKDGGFYTLNDLKTDYTELIDGHLVTGRLESEVELTERNHLAFGVEETFLTTKTTEKMSGWTDLETDSGYLFNEINFSSVTDGNCIFDSAAFASWTFGNDNDLLQSEIGVRGEFISLKNYEDDYTVNFIPDVCPRANVTLTPWRNKGSLEKASITAGTGLFVSVPRETMIFTKEMGLENFEMRPNRSLMFVLGADALFTNGWKLKCEAYGKYYLSRIFHYQSTDASSGFQDVSMIAKSNGKGYVFGFDTMLEKKDGDFWDGYVSYSFVYSKFKNPVNTHAGEYTTSDAPLDEWYFPSYHRFHTLNLVSNWHFNEHWTLSVKGTLATGCPMDKTGDVFCYASKMEDGTVIQRYTRNSVYSDTLRTDISCPVDLRLSYQWKSNNEKTLWEFYFGLQDIFVNLYSPEGNKSFDQYTGEMSEVPDSADFGLGIPIPSFGLKVKF